MKIHELLSKQVEDVRNGIISAINNFLIAKNVEEITLHNSFVYKEGDDQFSEIIEGYNTKTQTVYVGHYTSDYNLPISELETRDLLFILEQVENETYSF
jgi:hypothetical protein